MADMYILPPLVRAAELAAGWTGELNAGIVSHAKSYVPHTGALSVCPGAFHMSRSVLSITFAAMLSTTAAMAQAPAAPALSGLTTVVLPPEVTFPEGIAYDASSNAIFTASAATGTLVRVDLKSGGSQIVAPAGVLVPKGETTFPAVLGMKLDPDKRLWIAGGRTGRFFVVDSKTGRVVKSLAVPNPGKSLINDLALAGGAAYFTDTVTPTLWRIQTKGSDIGDLEPWLDFTGTALQYYEGANLNGIAALPDGQSLIVVQMGKGLLFRIDLKTKKVSPIDTAGAGPHRRGRAGARRPHALRRTPDGGRDRDGEPVSGLRQRNGRQPVQGSAARVAGHGGQGGRPVAGREHAVQHPQR